MLKLNKTLMRTAALAAVIGSFAAASPFQTARAQDAAPDAMGTQTTAPVAQSAPALKSSDMHMKKHDGEMDVETRIKSLHDKLKITSSEETDWATVAQTMRDNESALHELVEARHQNGETMTAIDDLQSYQQIAQAHADGAQKMVAAFKTLYNEMSADQQKNADEVFGRFEGHRGGHDKKHS